MDRMVAYDRPLPPLRPDATGVLIVEPDAPVTVDRHGDRRKIKDLGVHDPHTGMQLVRVHDRPGRGEYVVDEVAGRYVFGDGDAPVYPAWLVPDPNDRADAASPWIPVTERLPEPDTTVLVYDGEDVSAAYCFITVSGEMRFDGSEGSSPDATHWMPLPEPPKE